MEKHLKSSLTKLFQLRASPCPCRLWPNAKFAMRSVSMLRIRFIFIYYFAIDTNVENIGSSVCLKCRCRWVDVTLHLICNWYLWSKYMYLLSITQLINDRHDYRSYCKDNGVENRISHFWDVFFALRRLLKPIYNERWFNYKCSLFALYLVANSLKCASFIIWLNWIRIQAFIICSDWTPEAFVGYVRTEEYKQNWP